MEAIKRKKHDEIETINITKTDFTKKGAQRLAALALLKAFNDSTRKAWTFAVAIAKAKLQKSDGIDKTKVVNSVFQRIGQKKPFKNESGVIHFEIYGQKSEIKSTNDSNQDQSSKKL